MLIDENGRRYGMISGGCLEEDVIHQAIEVLQSGKAKMLSYDNKKENELSWGQWSGSIGVVYIYIEKTGWDILKRQKWKVPLGNHRAKIINRASCDFDKLHR